jgi:hypothetical protein
MSAGRAWMIFAPDAGVPVCFAIDARLLPS